MARDHAEVNDLRELKNHFGRKALAEIGVFLAIAKIVKRQHRDRFSIDDWKSVLRDEPVERRYRRYEQKGADRDPRFPVAPSGSLPFRSTSGKASCSPLIFGLL